MIPLSLMSAPFVEAMALDAWDVMEFLMAKNMIDAEFAEETDLLAGTNVVNMMSAGLAPPFNVSGVRRRPAVILWEIESSKLAKRSTTEPEIVLFWEI